MLALELRRIQDEAPKKANMSDLARMISSLKLTF